jgi:hypothetical protein
MQAPRRVVRAGLVGAILVGAVTVGATATSGQEAPEVAQPPLPTGCDAPYPASFSAVQPYRSEVEVPYTGTWLGWPETIMDTDGDGETESYGVGGPEGLVIDRTTGTLTISDAVRLTFGGGEIGDLDGDGRTEIIVATGEPGPTFLIPGATPDGTHAAADVGVLLPETVVGGRTVGDADGDGLSDLMLVDTGPPDGRRPIVAGADLLAPGPGGTFVEGDLALASYDGIDAGRVGFGSPRATVITSPDLLRGAQGDDVTLVVNGIDGAPRVVLTTAGSGLGLPPGPDLTTRNADIVVDGDTMWVVLFVQGDTGDAHIWAWELTDLCGAVVPPTVPDTTPDPTTPPAAPIRAPAAFTG